MDLSMTQGISDAHFNATHLAFAPTSEQSWLEGSFLGAYSPATFSDPYLQLVQSPSLNGTISKLSGNQVDTRYIFCTQTATKSGRVLIIRCYLRSTVVLTV